MGPLDVNQIPGYREACEEEQQLRELAFLSSTIPVCGIELRHLTPRTFLMLQAMGCRFINGGRPDTEDVAMAYWFLSPEYSRDEAKRNDFITEKVARLPFIESVKSMYQHLANAFIDAPASGGLGGKEYWASVASLVHLIADAYGWDDEAILDKPLGRLFQYSKVIGYARNPKRPLFNRSDKYVSDWLLNQNTQRN